MPVEYADFTQVSQLQALGSFAGGGVVGVSRHRRHVAAQVAEILREGTAAFSLCQYQPADYQVLRYLTENPGLSHRFERKCLAPVHRGQPVAL